MKLSTSNKNLLNTFYLFVILIITSLYVVLFWNLPLSEDAGYYAFLSKIMSQGAVLHNDIPATTNSLLLYLTTAAFKIFGDTKFIFRMIYALGYLLLIAGVYKLVSKQRSLHEAFIASLLCAVLVMIPHVMLDLGRNQIIWCLAFIVIGFHLKLNLHKNFFSGFCFAISALMRETFLIVLVALSIVLFFQIMINRKNEQRSDLIKEYIYFISGACSGLFINVLLLTYYHSWGSYFIDMLQSGVSFRYKKDALITSVLQNLHQFKYGLRHYYRPFIIFSALSYYYFPKKGSLIFWVQYFLLPIFFIEAVVINRTQTYSIAPMLLIFAILSSYFFVKVYENILRARIKLFWKYLFGVFVICIMILMRPYFYDMYSNYHSYYVLLALTDKKQTNNWVTDRVENVITALPPTKKMAVNSMYSLLFEINEPIEYGFPYLYDLSAPNNLGRKILAEAQIKAIAQQDIDIVILKDAQKTPTKDFKEYITIADFPKSQASTIQPYKNTILLSRQFFKRYFYKTLSFRHHDLNHVIRISNDKSEAMLIRIKTSSIHCLAGLRVKSGLSQISYDPDSYKNAELFSIILPHDTAIIDQGKLCHRENSFIDVDLYKIRSDGVVKLS